ncbi:MAG: hypothetical protein EA355_05935 [Rhodobacteraceae bacterium]|nr:MAG: hypothetical protein EA355_05935 [Paracoccaceae bacterium]
MTRRPPEDDDRRQRLAEALRANLRRRKAQSRARADGEAPEGPQAVDAEEPETQWTASSSPAERR